MHFPFLFASLGVINGVIVGLYLLTRKNRSITEMYFAGLILALCIRIGKSVFLYFFPETDKLVLQIGLSACIYIGPFFYLYIKSLYVPLKKIPRSDLVLLLSLAILVVIVGLLFPYRSYPSYWNTYIIQTIYLIWGVFFTLGIYYCYQLIGPNFFKFWKLNQNQKYLMLIVAGVFLITLTYQLALHIKFTYIWGAFIFSILLYILAFRALIKDKSIAPKPSPNKLKDGQVLYDQIKDLMTREKLYTSPDLKFDDLAKKLNISRHKLSQVMNETYSSGYTNFIRNYRIDEAKKLISERPELSLEGIGYESGFKSKSVFFDSFRKLTGLTPSAYKKQLEDKTSSN